MEWTMWNVSSVTNAMRGKSALERQGFTVQIQRAINARDNNGCGYRLRVKGDGKRIGAILESVGVRATNGGVHG